MATQYPRGHKLCDVYSQSRAFASVKNVLVPRRPNSHSHLCRDHPSRLARILTESSSCWRKIGGSRAGAQDRVYLFFKNFQTDVFHCPLRLIPTKTFSAALHCAQSEAFAPREVCCYLVMIVRRHDCLLALRDQPSASQTPRAAFHLILDPPDRTSRYTLSFLNVVEELSVFVQHLGTFEFPPLVLLMNAQVLPPVVTPLLVEAGRSVGNEGNKLLVKRDEPRIEIDLVVGVRCGTDSARKVFAAGPQKLRLEAALSHHR